MDNMIEVRMERSSKDRGFSLVEMGVVLVIISLIIGSVIAGQDMIRAAKVKSVVSQLEEFQGSYGVFVEKYHANPGDYRYANIYLGSTAGEIGNGNGRINWNGLVGANYEGPMAWYHMRLAGLINGPYGTILNSLDGVPGSVVPAAKMGGDGSGFYMDYDATPGIATYGGAMGNFMGLGGFGGAGTGINDDAVLTSIDSENIDRKLDDGLPKAGIIYAIQASAVANSCLTGSAYTLNVELVACRLMYKLD